MNPQTPDQGLRPAPQTTYILSSDVVGHYNDPDTYASSPYVWCDKYSLPTSPNFQGPVFREEIKTVKNKLMYLGAQFNGKLVRWNAKAHAEGQYGNPNNPAESSSTTGWVVLRNPGYQWAPMTQDSQNSMTELDVYLENTPGPRPLFQHGINYHHLRNQADLRAMQRGEIPGAAQFPTQPQSQARNLLNWGLPTPVQMGSSQTGMTEREPESPTQVQFTPRKRARSELEENEEGAGSSVHHTPTPQHVANHSFIPFSNPTEQSVIHRPRVTFFQHPSPPALTDTDRGSILSYQAQGSERESRFAREREEERRSRKSRTKSEERMGLQESKHD